MAGRTDRRAFSRGAIHPDFGALRSPDVAASPGEDPPVMMVTATIAPARSASLRRVWAHPSATAGGLDVETRWGVWTDQRDAVVRLQILLPDVDAEVGLLFEYSDLNYAFALVECGRLLLVSPEALVAVQARGALAGSDGVGIEVSADPTVLARLRPVIARREAPDDVPAEWRTAPTAPTAGRALYPDLDESIPFVVVPTRDDPELAALFAWRRKVDDPVEAGLTVSTAWAALNDRVGADITFTRAGTAPIRRRWLLPTDVAWLTAAGSAAVLLITEADAARQCAPWPVGLPFGGYPSQALAGAVARMTHGEGAQN